jgi:hypothetical protein
MDILNILGRKHPGKTPKKILKEREEPISIA